MFLNQDFGHIMKQSLGYSNNWFQHIQYLNKRKYLSIWQNTYPKVKLNIKKKNTTKHTENADYVLEHEQI